MMRGVKGPAVIPLWIAVLLVSILTTGCVAAASSPRRAPREASPSESRRLDSSQAERLSRSDEQLRGVLAHEIAHDDLGHVARAQILGAGLSLGAVLLEQLVPGSKAIAPIAGTLIARGYSRSEEYEADRHGVEILRRTGYSKEVMINALSWVQRTSQSSGSGGGGFLSTHPAIPDRIEALRTMR
ncbi:MAG: M48 family metalloprotease [Deltaproteobacteria bacterium]|nr:M48 family metalloprotease [Deltaproteobacteria bacterium]